jgi:hypothetical protein
MRKPAHIFLEHSRNFGIARRMARPFIVRGLAAVFCTATNLYIGYRRWLPVTAWTPEACLRKSML